MRLLRPIAGGWPVILADPPWQFQTYSGGAVPARGVQPYHTMTLADLKQLPVQTVAAKDCALFLWVLDSMIPQAIELAAAWGFTKYVKVGFNWCKPDMGMGYWTRNDTELCLLFTRGRPKRLNADVRQRIGAPAGKHSEKPIDTYTKIERLIAGPYLELFAREGACAYKGQGWREGWTPWGLEAPGLNNRLLRLEAAVDRLTALLEGQADEIAPMPYGSKLRRDLEILMEMVTPAEGNEFLAKLGEKLVGRTEPCTLGMGCDEAGFCYAMAHDHPEECPVS